MIARRIRLRAPVVALALICMSAAPFGQTTGPTGIPADRFPLPSRPVASIISDRWATEDTRERIGEAATVMQLLDIQPGMTVADIGAGAGYYTVRLSARVGPTGRVFAQDIIPAYLANLQRRVTQERLANVTVVTGEPHDPRLAPGSVDVAVLVHMYHEITQPFGLLANLLPALRPGARIGILDANRPTQQHGTPPALLECELRSVGYRQVAFHPMEDGAAYLAVFTPPDRVPDRIEPCR
ncbi:MAG: methyltransferase domain-containing protein [Gemmatimonadaceae bacterium]|nr:methyltransferase domain-containing protein [Acetobacteraceae bacterium]